MKNFSFTLVEVVITMVVLAAVAAFAIPSFLEMQRLSLAQRAIETINLLALIEDDNFLTTGSYLPCADLNACNVMFGLDIPDDPDWNYAITTGPPDEYCIAAVGQGELAPAIGSRREDEEDPIDGNCP